MEGIEALTTEALGSLPGGGYGSTTRWSMVAEMGAGVPHDFPSPAHIG